MNDILFGNNNKKVLNRLAKADLRTNKLKTILSGITIVIAICLMAVVLTVLINGALSQTALAPYHAMYLAVKEETKDRLLGDTDFETAGVYKNIGGTADADGSINVAYMDKSAMDLWGHTLTEGTYPTKENEVLVSAAYLEKKQLTIGSSFQLSFTNALSNRQMEQRFRICGIIENEKLKEGKQFYILVSDSFRRALAESKDSLAASSFSTQTPETVDILLKLNAEKSSFSADQQKELLKNKGMELGIKEYDIVLNIGYIEGLTLDDTVLAGVIFFMLFLVFASSIVIYSIFNISVINSLRMYARMTALGATGKQLRYFIKRQGNILSVCFIPLGMLMSLLITAAVSGIEWIAVDLVLTLVSGLLAFTVIKIALRKPAKMLVSISPVEAMKYTGSGKMGKHTELRHITPDTLAKSNLSANWRKNRMSVISLSISGTLMIAFVMLLASIDVPGMLMQYYPLNEQFQVGIQMDNFYERLPQIIRNNPLSDELTDKILSIPGVEKVIKEECVLGEMIEPDIAYESADDNMEIIDSLSPELLANVSSIVSGSIDYEDIGMDGIIINQFRVANSNLNYDAIKTGDVITFQFRNGRKVTEKNFRVIGIAHFPSTGLFYTSPEVLGSISPYNNTTHLSVFCSDEKEPFVGAQLQKMIAENAHLRLKIYSEEFTVTQYAMRIYMNGLYGVFIFIIFFGLLNMVNILINSALLRKREFALLQAVGMTNRQLRRMLYREGINTSVKTVCTASAAGMLLGWLLWYLAYEVMSFKFFVFRVSVFPIFLFAVLLIGLQMAVSFCICKSIESDTLIERLRTE